MNLSKRRLNMDVDRYEIIKKFGYKNGTFIQYLIDYAENLCFKKTNPTDPNGKQIGDLVFKSCQPTRIIHISPTQQEIFDKTGMSFFTQRGVCNKLKSLKILKIKRKGAPARNWYTLNLTSLRKNI